MHGEQGTKIDYATQVDSRNTRSTNRRLQGEFSHRTINIHDSCGSLWNRGNNSYQLRVTFFRVLNRWRVEMGCGKSGFELTKWKRRMLRQWPSSLRSIQIGIRLSAILVGSASCVKLTSPGSGAVLFQDRAFFVLILSFITQVVCCLWYRSGIPDSKPVTERLFHMFQETGCAV